MAENDAEKNQQPTQKRLDEARKKGQIPRSQELSAAAVVLAAGGALHFLGRGIGNGMFDLMRDSLTLSREQAMDASSAISMFASADSAGHLGDCAPPRSHARRRFAGPDVDRRLEPGFRQARAGLLATVADGGFRPHFSMRGAVELVKAFAKFAVVAVIAVIFLWNKTSEMMGLGMEPTAAGIGHAITLAGQSLLVCAGGLVLIAAIDVPFQLFQHIKSLQDDARRSARGNEGVGR